VPGVTRAWVLPLHYGLGTVAVAVVNDNGSNGIIPDAALLARVSAHIEQVRPVTARVSVIAPKERKVRYRLRITPDTAAARAAVEAALRDYHLREANLGGVLHLSRISEAISLAAGEFSHAIQEPAADIVCTSTEIATYGGVTWPD
jgi:baseplate J-like protein